MNKSLFSIPPIAPKFVEEEPVFKPIKTRFKLDTTFFDELLKRLEEQKNKNSKLFRKIRKRSFGWFSKNEEKRLTFTNLSREILSELIETAFWASLEKEEGRSLKFSISYRCLVNEETSTDNLYDSDLIFQEFKEFTVKNVVKLAPAVFDGSSMLISTSDNKTLKITGLSLNGFVPLKISVLDPGKLLISYDLENIAIISGSEVVFIRDASLFRSSSLWIKLFPNDENKTVWDNPSISVIINTLREMRKLGHGGILIIVPDNKKYQKSIDLPIPYCSNSLFNYGSELLGYYDDKKLEDKNYFGYELTHLSELFAQFTAIDGATLLTNKLDLIGFGIKLKNSRSKKYLPTIYKLDPLDHDDWFKRITLTDLGNMRHQSAARFVINQKDSLAFVVSQDGGITGLVYDHNIENNSSALYAYSKLELSLF